VKQKQSLNDVGDYDEEELKIPTSCAELQCRGAARCVIDERTGHARCRCPLGTTGLYCQQQFFLDVAVPSAPLDSTVNKASSSSMSCPLGTTGLYCEQGQFSLDVAVPSALLDSTVNKASSSTLPEHCRRGQTHQLNK